MMPLGKPAIVNPRSAERDVGVAIGNIRERIESLEAEFTALRSRVLNGFQSAADARSAIDVALAELASLRRRVSDLEKSAPVAVHVNGELVGVRKVVDFRSLGGGVQIVGDLLEDRVVVTVSVGSYVMLVQPARLELAGGNVP